MFSKKIYILVLSLCLTLSLFAQKEQNNWFFGIAGGLTWNTTRPYTGTGMFGATNVTLTGIPNVITGSPISTYEGCFSLSDVNGNLLFFSDGMTIWNRSKLPMTNGTGLTGNPSSAQSGIIFPYPGSPSRYVALTLGNNGANNLSYSIVDMSQSLGLGAVETANKNILFTGQSGLLGENVTAVRHTNKNDFWIVAVGRGTPTYFNVWKVTALGGIQTARHSVASIPQTTAAATASGYIKFTQDGKNFVWNSFNENFFVFGSFDPTTGILSNLKVRTGGAPAYSYGYGVEFSPNGRYLYVTYSPASFNSPTVYNSQIAIYDLPSLLSATNPDLIAPVKTFYIGANCCDLFSGIQLGPDNRMYISDINTNNLFIMPNPDTPTTTKLYKLTGVLGAGIVQFGLPSFTAPWFKMNITPNSPVGCAESPQNYTMNIENGMGFSKVTKIVIDFGDGAVNSRVTVNTPSLGTSTYSYKYKKAGTYTITLTAYNSSNGVELSQTSTAQINSCAIKVNKNVRGINK